MENINIEFKFSPPKKELIWRDVLPEEQRQIYELEGLWEKYLESISYQ